MEIELIGIRSPEKVSAAERLKKVNAVCEKHKGKRVWQMTKPEQEELLEAIAQQLGLADENGVIK